jgi:hypothetical protein
MLTTSSILTNYSDQEYPNSTKGNSAQDFQEECQHHQHLQKSAGALHVVPPTLSFPRANGRNHQVCVNASNALLLLEI